MRIAIVLIVLLGQTGALAQEDTASVTYVPSEDVYLLHYNLLGISYTDTLVPATRIAPVVACAVSKEAEVFHFAYSLSLLPTSQQYLSSFMVSHPAAVLNPTKPNARWSQGEFAQYKVWDWSNSLMDPSGLWTPTTDVGPGGSMTGFSFRSIGLPTIVSAYLEGNAPLLAFTAEPPQLLYNLLDTIDVFPYNTVVRRTLGPKDPPSPFNALTFLDTIASDITESRTLGWIANDPTKNKYTRLIDSAKANLSANPTRRGTAKARLDSVLLNVYPDSAAALITSEAYALLRFNTEYVLKKLREEDSTFAEENKSSSWDATATNNARHLAKSEGHAHEVFISGGEVVYRRSDDEGATWIKTDHINTAVGENASPGIATTLNNSIQIVWQRKVGASTYEVWHAYSSDNGESWSSPAILPGADSVAVSAYQTGGAMPVVAGMEGMLAIVYCSSEGLRYRVSDDEGQCWQVPQSDIISGQANDEVRCPSLAGATSYISLVYDYAGGWESPWSRTFDGTLWSDERSLGKGTDISDAELSCVAIDAEGNPIAVWTGVGSSMTYGKVTAFRAGYSDNTWSDWFTMFGQNFVDQLGPSVTYYNRDGEYGVGIIHHTSEDAIKLITLTDVNPPAWDITSLSTSGAWATVSHEGSGLPLYGWTDQSGPPYEIMAGSGFTKMQGRMGSQRNPTMRHNRRAVIGFRDTRSSLAVEFEQMRIVHASGDTTAVPFKQSPLRQRGTIRPSNVWEYLGTEVLRLPASTRRLVVAKQFGERGTPPRNGIYSLRLLNAEGDLVAVLDITSGSGTVSVDIARYAGSDVILRPNIEFGSQGSVSVTAGVGDVFVAPADGRNK